MSRSFFKFHVRGCLGQPLRATEETPRATFRKKKKASQYQLVGVGQGLGMPRQCVQTTSQRRARTLSSLRVTGIGVSRAEKLPCEGNARAWEASKLDECVRNQKKEERGKQTSQQHAVRRQRGCHKEKFRDHALPVRGRTGSSTIGQSPTLGGTDDVGGSLQWERMRTHVDQEFVTVGSSVAA